MSDDVQWTAAGVGPKCPNHKCVLLKTGGQEGRKQKWQCPVSSALFDVEVDVQAAEYRGDKFGRKLQALKIVGND